MQAAQPSALCNGNHRLPAPLLHIFIRLPPRRQDEFSATGVSGELFSTIDKALDERTIGHNPERLCLLKVRALAWALVAAGGLGCGRRLGLQPARCALFWEGQGSQVRSGRARLGGGGASEDPQRAGHLACANPTKLLHSPSPNSSPGTQGGIVYSNAVTTVSPNYANETLNGGGPLGFSVMLFCRAGAHQSGIREQARQPHRADRSISAPGLHTAGLPAAAHPRSAPQPACFLSAAAGLQARQAG